MNSLKRFRQVIKHKDRAIFAEAALELRRWMIANDPHRPIYHFAGPESWTNDPNGPIFYQGQYHLFYQFDPIVDGQRSNRCWGHAVSPDLVHWTDWPVALWPDTPYDHYGVYSGNTFVDDNGHLCALYTGNVAGHKEAYGIFARSKDEGLTWQKKLVMDNAQRPNANSPVHWDGFIWRDGQTWHQLIGGATAGETPQGAAWLWTSADLEHWTLEKNIAPDIERGTFWELPYLIHLPGKDVLLVGNGNPYWLGRYDRAQMHFQPDSLTPMSIDNGHYYSFNPNMTDNKGLNGGTRRLMHGWITGPPSPTAAVPYWQGLHAIPRFISLKNGRIWQEPIPEINCLRGEHIRLENVEPADATLPHRLPITGDALELQATFAPNMTQVFGLKLRVSADGQDFVRVFYDPSKAEFGVDGSTLTQNAEDMENIKLERQASFIEQEQPGQPLSMRIFLDRSIIEVYVNGCVYTARAFSPPEAKGVTFFSEDGAARLQTLDVWEMKSSWLS